MRGIRRGSRQRWAVLAWIATAAACAGPPKPIAELTAEEWQEDLDWMIERLQRDHPDLYGYHDVNPAEFEEWVATLRGSIPGRSAPHVMLGLDQLIASVGDGHTSLDAVQSAAGLPRCPLQLAWLGDRLIVVALPRGDTQGLGAEVTAISTTEVAEVLERISPLISRDNDQELLHASPAYLTCPDVLVFCGVVESGAEVLYTLRSEDREVTRAFQPLPLQEVEATEFVTARKAFDVPTPLYLSRPGETHWTEGLPDHRALYAKCNRIDDGQRGPSLGQFFDEILRELDSGRWNRLILDFRHNTGGNFTKARRFVDAAIQHSALREPGSLVVLTSPHTFSAATYVASQLHVSGNAVLIGQPSRGNPNRTYNAETVSLPNSRLHMEYTTNLFETPPFPELGDLRYLPVEVEVFNSVEDYLAGRDRVLETALSYDPAEGRRTADQ